MALGLISAFLVVEQLYMGPWDLIIGLAYLSSWGNWMTFITILLQFKSAQYEIGKDAYIRKEQYS